MMMLWNTVTPFDPVMIVHSEETEEDSSLSGMLKYTVSSMVAQCHCPAVVSWCADVTRCAAQHIAVALL
jgi:hypothetical protein